MPSRLVANPGTSRTTIGPLAERLDGAAERVHDLGRGFLGGHDLDQLHHVDGIEEVEPGHALGAGRLGGQACDRQRGGVARQDRALGAARVQLGEHLALEVEDLGDRLDREVRVGDRFPEIGLDPQALERPLLLRRVELPALDALGERFLDLLPGAMRGLGVDVVERSRVAGLREGLRDPAAHRPRADHRHHVQLVDHGSILRKAARTGEASAPIQRSGKATNA